MKYENVGSKSRHDVVIQNLKTPLFLIAYWQHVTLPLAQSMDIN